MRLGKRQKKRQQRRKKDSPLGELRFFKHPFSQIPQGDLIKGLIDVGRLHAENFPKLLEEIQTTINGIDALQAIATLSTYGLMSGITKAGVRKPLLNEERFNQSHVELLQAFALRKPENQRSHHPSLPENIQKLLEVLPDLADSFSARRLVQMEASRTQEEKAVLLLQEHLRAHTQTVRNWGYYHRVVRIIRDLVAPIDHVFSKEIGIPASALLSLFEKLVDDREARASVRMQKLSKVIAQTTVESAIRAYYEVNPQLQDTADSMITVATSRKYSLDTIRSIFLSHSELSLAEECTFNAHEAAKYIPVDPVGLKLALNKMSLAFGDLADENSEHFFLTNPVWTRPLIRLSDERYFCAIPMVFFSFAFPILEHLLKDNATSLRQYFDRRAEFLEQEVVQSLRKAFPESEYVANYQWKETTETFESDLIVRIDSHLLLVEAKSGAISWPALRGAPDRARTHALQLLLSPSQQSLRLQYRIEKVLANPQLKNELLPNLGIDIAKVRKVLRLSITLEDFAILQSNMHLFKETGWIPKEHPLAACILLADLEIVLDILELTPLKLHYIQRRAQLEDGMDYLGDEIDLLGFYLQTGFNVGSAELGGPHFILTMMSKPIDKYYMGIDDDIRLAKPRPRLTQWWRDLCMTFEKRRFHQWSEIAVVLLNFSFSEQQNIEKSLKKIAKNVFKKWREPSHLSAITVIPEVAPQI
jgi:hypothetical protein